MVNDGHYRIGIDVGDTTPAAKKHSSRGVVAHAKTSTTADPTDGIVQVIRRVIEVSRIESSAISSVTIGTTHFINAVIERDAHRLSPVAILRVSKSHLREIPPFTEWPSSLSRVLNAYVGYVDGGLAIDGTEEAPIAEAQVVAEARKIKELGISAIVIAGVFSPIDDTFQQEDRIRDIISQTLPHADVVCSHEVANIGFLERENASILNAAILQYARITLTGFKRAIGQLGLSCSLYITQNDGTVLDAASAARLPIRTFLSGPTNSMRGAAYLAGSEHASSQSIVIDIGGTTSDVGVLLPSGMPRQAAAYTKFAGVDLNYAMPQLHSVGLGGGSIVKKSKDEVFVGPKSVGKDLLNSSLVFGGNVLTATDIAVAAGHVAIGDETFVRDVDRSLITRAESSIKQQLERAIDHIKLNPEPLPVLLVGGGAILAPTALKGASSVVRPPFHDVANAVGAAISRVCGSVDIIQSTADQTSAQAVEHAKDLAKREALKAGAKAETLQVAEVEALPVSYIEGRVRTVVKVTGEIDTSAHIQEQRNGLLEDDSVISVPSLPRASTVDTFSGAEVIINHLEYRPKIVITHNGRAEWIVSETDVAYLADGCYILGCAGGGSPRAMKMQLQAIIRAGHTMRIIDHKSLKDSDLIYGGGGLGSPAVGVERLPGADMTAYKALMAYMRHDSFQAVMPIEVGGLNGIVPLLAGSSRFFDAPVIDADWMGRAYPTAWQTTLSAHAPGNLVPCAIDGGDGNTIIMTSSSEDQMVDKILRAACMEMGWAVNSATTDKVEHVRAFAVHNTLSLAWRLGRCIARAQATNSFSTVADAIIDEAGGPSSAKILFRGKIVEVENKLFKGHNHGVVHVKAFSELEEDWVNGVRQSEAFARGGTLRIPFKNENIYAEHVAEDGTSNIIASVPDLIAVLDNGSGRAVGIPEYRYGLRVTVIGITASEKWTYTIRALEIGGPKAFGFDHEYVPLGKYVAPKSVIDEYGEVIS